MNFLPTNFLRGKIAKFDRFCGRDLQNLTKLPYLAINFFTFIIVLYITHNKILVNIANCLTLIIFILKKKSFFITGHEKNFMEYIHYAMQKILLISPPKTLNSFIFIKE